ncbi:fibronectin type III domain-containing protein [Nocardioides xinjiangensis]|uniref:fibronectin type III domain-containing protein n=1 Tax=Nocardioides xinjiangensis TaxID=2817376 RepID=UPI0027DDCC00|nr:fibronectin type III domain-containing protein [Nocardioides sp. SYSU D00514]
MRTVSSTYSSGRVRRLPLLAACLVVASVCAAVVPASGAPGDPRTIIGWGRNTWGEADVPLGMAHVKQVSATAHSMVLLEDGTVRSWGHDRYGEATVPPGLADVTQIAAGGFHSLALTSDGALVAWGQNDVGQTDVPPGLHDIASISGGRYHSLVLHGDGTVTGWGGDADGQSTVPAGLHDVVAVDAGGYHSLALRSDGTVVAWGDDTYGQSAVPAGLHDVVAVAAGWNHSLALRSDGTLAAWGSNEHGQATVPAGLPPVASITAGAMHTLVALRDGTVATWGDSAYGVTTVPPGITGVTQVSAKAMHSMVLADDPPPTQVTGLLASVVTNAKVTLNWAYPATDTDHDVARIIVRGAPGAVPPATVADGVEVPTGRPMQQYATHVNDLAVGERYSYSVFTQDAAGNVGAAASITVPTSFPAPVTQAAHTVDSPSSVTLTWTNPDNDQLKRIIVRRAAGTTPPATAASGSNVTLAAPVTQTVTNTGLSPGTTYSWSIFAQDRIGNISPLGSGSTVTANLSGAVQPPAGGATASPVTNLQAPIVTNAKVNLTWQYPSGTVRVVVRGAPGTTPPATVTAGVEVPTGRPVTTSATDVTGLEVGQRYSYSVFTQDAAGRTSVPVSITVPVTMPAPVTQAVATVDGPTSVTLTWTNPVNDQLKTIIVRRAVGATPPATHTSGTTVRLPAALAQGVTDSGLTANTTYSYSIFAQDRVGNISPLGAGSVVTTRTG